MRSSSSESSVSVELMILFCTVPDLATSTAKSCPSRRRTNSTCSSTSISGRGVTSTAVCDDSSAKTWAASRSADSTSSPAM